MARQTILPGKEIEIVTPAELKQLLASELRETPQRSITAGATGVTDAGTGIVVCKAYKVPDGMEFELGWVLVESADTRYDVPVARGGGFGVQVEVNDACRDIFPWSEDPAAPGTFRFIMPQRRTYGTGDAIRCQNGSVISVRVHWTANIAINVTLGGRLYATPVGE